MFDLSRLTLNSLNGLSSGLLLGCSLSALLSGASFLGWLSGFSGDGFGGLLSTLLGCNLSFSGLYVGDNSFRVLGILNLA